MILNLAVFFGYHIWWPHRLAARIDVFSVLLTLGSAIALLRYNQSVMRVIGAAAVAGLVMRLGHF